MGNRRLGNVTTALCLALTANLSAAPSPPSDPQKSTLAAVHSAGIAMLSWWTDYTHADSEPSQAPGQLSNTVDWFSCQPITHADLTALLVPIYARELPATDGWGNELEFCLEREDRSTTRNVVGVLSPGRDGAFEGKTYQRGAYAESDLDRDILWLDGLLFARPAGTQ